MVRIVWQLGAGAYRFNLSQIEVQQLEEAWNNDEEEPTITDWLNFTYVLPLRARGDPQ